ncbi:hypothetical protein TNCV_5077201 [Trichonephila clavipes]|uniref:Uncharacterized protein n=1 Tax=Trichonephila clavipes TaxID=2585209 RepID=A0A8X6VAX2_TRICX|nr:hypothetical protein TNCV_5077201 [Trichonephila clavipes]
MKLAWRISKPLRTTHHCSQLRKLSKEPLDLPENLQQSLVYFLELSLFFEINIVQETNLERCLMDPIPWKSFTDELASNDCSAAHRKGRKLLMHISALP